MHPVHAPVLHMGSRGAEVVRLQLALREQGYLLRPDGRFGPMTREAVVTFQSTHHLPPTGEVDAASWDALEDTRPAFPCRAAR